MIELLTRGESYDLFTEWAKGFLDKIGISAVYRVAYHDIARMAFKASYEHNGEMLACAIRYITTKGVLWQLDAEKVSLIIAEVVKKPWLDNIVTEQTLP